jgi:hypothetical protein
MIYCNTQSIGEYGMPMHNDELHGIVTKFAESGWDLLDVPARAWLASADTGVSTDTIHALISAIEEANIACGSCGCEFDPLYPRALALLRS